MLRTTGWVVAVLAMANVASSQEPVSPRNTLRIEAQRAIEKYAPQVRDAANTRANAPPQPRAARGDVLSALGAVRPFDYSSNKRYLVAATRDGSGLALWDVSARELLRRLDDSDRPYSIVTISDDARWIAAARQDEIERIDLWRADTGRHVRWIRTASGPARTLEFRNGNQLHVMLADSSGIVFNVPAGVVVERSQVARGKAAAKPPTATFQVTPPTTPVPSNSQAFRPSRPPSLSREEYFEAESSLPVKPSVAAPAARSLAPALESLAPAAEETVRPQAMPVPRMAASASKPQGDVHMAPVETEAPASSVATAPPISAAAPQADVPSTAPQAAIAPPIKPPPSGSAPMAAAPDEPADDTITAEPGAAAPDDAVFEHVGSALDDAPNAATAERETAAAAPQPQSFRLEAHDEQPPQSAARSDDHVQTLAEPTAPTTLDIHYATNRNRLAAKDREFLVYFAGFFGSLPAFVIYGLVILAALILPWIGKRSWALTAVLAGSGLLCAMGLVEAYVRSQLRDEMSGELYGCRPVELTYGKCTISIPPPQNRQAGEMSRPLSVWVFEAPENSEEHFLLKDVEEHADKDAFYRSLSAKLDKSDSRAALLFVHGYNVSFEDAIFRTAQLSVDLKFAGATMAFCWPSYADPVKYTFDEQNAEVSIPALHEVLHDLATRSGARSVHIIAHSMGNRVLAGALRSMEPDEQEQTRQIVRELVLAAPDIDSRVFRSQVLPHIVNSSQHCTLYASSRDRALLMSRVFHNYQRLGETEPELVLAQGLDTIDASLVDTSLLGHSYIGDVQSIVSDLHGLVVQGKRATERLGLELLKRQAQHYWLIKPEVQTASDASLRR